MTDLNLESIHMTKFSGFKLLVLALGAALLSACGGESEPESAAVAPTAGPSGSEQAQAYYAANPEFFSFKTPADVPTDLVWEDGADLPDIGSPEAKKGGIQYEAMQDYPRTLRHVGPDTWSRRIDEEHRLVYVVTDTEIIVIQARFHYE